MHLPVGLIPNLDNVAQILPAAQCERFFLQNLPNDRMTIIQRTCRFEVILECLQWLKRENILFEKIQFNTKEDFYKSIAENTFTSDKTGKIVDNQPETDQYQGYQLDDDISYPSTSNITDVTNEMNSHYTIQNLDPKTIDTSDLEKILQS